MYIWLKISTLNIFLFFWWCSYLHKVLPRVKYQREQDLKEAADGSKGQRDGNRGSEAFDKIIFDVSVQPEDYEMEQEEDDSQDKPGDT